MAMNDVDALGLEDLAEADRERRMKPGLARQRDHWNIQPGDFSRPLARFVKATHHGVDVVGEPPAQLDDEPLGAAWRQAEHQLHYAGFCHRCFDKPKLCHSRITNSTRNQT